MRVNGDNKKISVKGVRFDASKDKTFLWINMLAA